MNYQQLLREQRPILPAHLVPEGATIELATFVFPIDQINDAERAVLDYAVAHPWIVGISAALIIGGILFLTIPVLVGFGPLGPVKGGLAAAWQSWIGNVVAGSLFAIIQRLVMTGVYKNVAAAMIAEGIIINLPPMLSGEKRIVDATWGMQAAVVAAAYAGWRAL